MTGGLRRTLAGRRVLAAPYRFLQRVALAGLNYGWGAGTVQESGERWVLGYVDRRVRPRSGPLTVLDAGFGA